MGKYTTKCGESGCPYESERASKHNVVHALRYHMKSKHGKQMEMSTAKKCVIDTKTGKCAFEIDGVFEIDGRASMDTTNMPAGLKRYYEKKKVVVNEAKTPEASEAPDNPIVHKLVPRAAGGDSMGDEKLKKTPRKVIVEAEHELDAEHDAQLDALKNDEEFTDKIADKVAARIEEKLKPVIEVAEVQREHSSFDDMKEDNETERELDEDVKEEDG